MSNQVFQQNLDDKKGPQPGGPYLIQMLFKEPVEIWLLSTRLSKQVKRFFLFIMIRHRTFK